MSSKKLIIIVLTVLLIVEVVFIAKRYSEKVEQAPMAGVNIQVKVPDNPNLTPAEKDLFLTKPLAASTSIERFDHMTKAASIATETSEVSLTGCIPAPVVSRVKSGNTIVFKNVSIATTTLIFFGEEYPLVSGQSVTIGPLTSGPKLQSRLLIPFSCNKEGGVGYVYVSP